jgi:hypothetical protein
LAFKRLSDNCHPERSEGSRKRRISTDETLPHSLRSGSSSFTQGDRGVIRQPLKHLGFDFWNLLRQLQKPGKGEGFIRNYAEDYHRG